MHRNGPQKPLDFVKIFAILKGSVLNTQMHDTKNCGLIASSHITPASYLVDIPLND